MQIISTHWRVPALLLVCSLGPLGLALVSQYGFGLHPCELCLWQRVPYSVVAVLGVLAIWLRNVPHHQARLLLLAIVLWGIEAGIAFYHVGVEQQWWQSATGCTTQLPSTASLADLKAAILGSPLVSCSDVGATILGLSMAAWNIVAALGFASVGLCLLGRKGK